MKKFLLNIVLFFLFFIFFLKPAYSDVISPEYFNKTCFPSEMEVECSYSSTQPFGDRTYDECAKYVNNPNYRYLVGAGHSLGGGINKYCFKAVSTVDFIFYHIKTLLPILLITLLLEIPIFLVFGFKGRRALLAVLSANLISLPLLYLATIFIPYSVFTVSVLTVLIMELLVVIFEAVFIKMILKEFSFKKILIYSFVANALSVILGGALLNIIGRLIA